MESISPQKKQGGIDRSYDSSLGPKWAFFLLHGIGVALSAYVVFGGGMAVMGQWFGKTWSVSEPFRAQVMFAAVVLYWLRHGITLFYLLQRKVDWGEVWGLSVFLILLEPGFCMLAAGITRTSPAAVGTVFWIAVGCVLLGSYLNTASEVQRKWWKADPANKGKCYTEGLFRYSMHINFFGDSVSFTGWALITGVLWSLAVPLFMTVAFIFYHIPALDRYLEGRYGDLFREYAKRTKKFMPFVY